MRTLSVIAANSACMSAVRYGIVGIKVHSCACDTQPATVRAFLCLEDVDKKDLPAELQDDDIASLLQQCPSVRDFIRENFGLYSPPADYKALRAENLRRTQRALNGAPGLSPAR
jgi:hypothetical protein